MKRATLALMLVSMSVVVVGTGCMPTMTVEEMKAMMPERPVELDQLNAFVGSWESTGTGTMAGLEEPLDVTGKNEARWDGDGWYMVEKGSMHMAGFDPMGMHAVWAYDARAKLFRTNWVDTMGSFAVGTAKYCKKTDTWHMKVKSRSPFGTTTGKGTTKFVDDNTVAWTWSEYALGGLIKTMDMKGTAKRR